MKRISSIVWLVLGLTLATLLVVTWFWADQQAKLSESAQRVDKAADPAMRVRLARQLLADNRSLDPGHRARVLLLIAEAQGRLGQADSMAATHRQALALAPRDHEICNNVAYQWATHGLALDSAASLAVKALALARAQYAKGKPAGGDRAAWARDTALTIGNYLDTHGWALYQLGRYAEAAALLREAQRRAPGGEIEHHLGMALYRAGDRPVAVGHLVASLNGTLERPDSARADAERAYREQHGSLRGFDDLLGQYREQAGQAAAAQDLAGGSDYTGKPAPDFTLPDLDGRPHRLSDLRGRVVVLNFWSTWSRTCLMTLPSLDKVHLRYRERGVVVCGIDLEGRDKVDSVRQFIANKGYGFPQLAGGMMGNGLDRVYGVKGIPTTFVVDQNGVIRYRHINYQDNLDQLLAGELDGLLKAQAKAAP